MNADWFVETVLPEISKNIPLANFRDRNGIFMWDLARAHTAKRSQEFCRLNFPDFVEHLFYPLNCPEIMPQDISLNNLLKRGLRQTDYRSRDSLIAGFRRSWNGITMEIVRASIDSIPDRLRKIIAAKGDLIDCD